MLSARGGRRSRNLRTALPSCIARSWPPNTSLGCWRSGTRAQLPNLQRKSRLRNARVPAGKPKRMHFSEANPTVGFGPGRPIPLRSFYGSISPEMVVDVFHPGVMLGWSKGESGMAIEQGHAFGRAILGLVTLTIAPPLIVTTYLWWSRTQNFVSVAADYLALATGVAAGVCGVIVLPFGRNWRAAIAVPYIMISSCALVLWTFEYVCRTFGACL